MKIYFTNQLYVHGLRFSAILLSAFLVYSGFSEFHKPSLAYSALALICLMPLYFVLETLPTEKNKKTLSPVKQGIHAFFWLWIFGFFAQIAAFSWIEQSIQHFAQQSSLIAYSLFVIYCLLSSLYFPVLFSPLILSRYYRAKNPNQHLPIFALCLSVTFLEIIIPRFCEWSFGLYMFHELYANQLSSLFGFNTMTFFILFTNFSLSKAFLLIKNKSPVKIILLNIGIWALIILFGKLHVDSIDKQIKGGETTRIAYVQPGFTFHSLVTDPLPSTELQYQDYNKLIEMSYDAISKSIQKDGRKPDLLAWPESVAPDLLLMTPWRIQAIAQFSANTGIPVLVQAAQWFTKNFKQKNSNDFPPMWSTSAIIGPNGVQNEKFQKWTLMPFGEYFPLEDYFPSLVEFYRTHINEAGKFLTGNSFQALPYKDDLFVAPLICFDSINPKLPYLQASQGKASVFVNQSNYIWMGNSNAGSYIKMINQARAIENGRSLLMISNSGPSTAFDPLGRTLFPATKILSQSTGFVDLPVYTGRTLFSYVYRWPLIILGMLSLLYIIGRCFKKSRT